MVDASHERSRVAGVPDSSHWPEVCQESAVRPTRGSIIRFLAALAAVVLATACGSGGAPVAVSMGSFLDLGVARRPTSPASMQVSRYETPSTIGVEFVEFPTTEVRFRRAHLEYRDGTLVLQLYFEPAQFRLVEAWLADHQVQGAQKMLLVNMRLLASSDCVVDVDGSRGYVELRTPVSRDAFRDIADTLGAR